MLTPLYHLAFYTVLLGLGLWFANRDRSEAIVFRNLTLGALVALAVSWFVLPVTTAEPMATRFLLATRDLAILAGAGFVFGFGFGLGRRIPIWIAVILLLMGLAYFLRDKLPIDLEAPTAATTTHEWSDYQELDPEAEFLLELAPDLAPSTLLQWAKNLGYTIAPAFTVAEPDITTLDSYYSLNVPNELSKDELRALEAELRKLPLLSWAEPNEIVVLENPLPATPQRKGRSTYANDPEIAQQWAFEALEMDAYYQQLATLRPVQKSLVVILDTGVDSEHEDLAANFRSIRSKYDNDPHRHGTHCAGIASAVTNNATGIASLNFDGAFVEVSSVKVLSANGMGTQKSIINGMLEAIDGGATVLSMSLGGFSNQSKQRAYEKVVRYADKKGAIIVASAGNSNRDAKDFSPVNASGVIGVSAIDIRLQRAAFSNKVNNIGMGIAAPGVNIFSTVPNNDYKSFSGTSMAAPFVSGLVGILKAIRPELTTKEVYDILHRSGKALSSGEDTGRMIQPAKAIELVR